MPDLTVLRPMDGCRVATCNGRACLFGAPPEVLKALLKTKIGTLEAIVLPDVRERGGVLLNNVEFLLYYFLFFEGGLEKGRRLLLVGDKEHLAQILELLRLTLLGPTAGELEAWGTDLELSREWLNAGDFFAIKDDEGAVRPVASFFDVLPFADDEASAGQWTIRREGIDQFEIEVDGQRALIDLNDCGSVSPPYSVAVDYVPSGFAKFAVEVLGGASGFSPDEPSTGMAICTNGHYVLIDAIPYVDQHLAARGISKNEVAAAFLTHLHDDHCNLFPLMRTGHKVDLITVPEIYAMAMRKLAMGLGWSVAVVEEHFNFVPLTLGERLRYYSLEIEPHHTVHSIPTVGATIRVRDHGHMHEVCIVGDIQTLADIEEMQRRGLLRADTVARLRSLYENRFDLLVADGGMGPIHGDPADALESRSERVVFVHVEELPERFNATFSLASSGKRYTVVEGQSDIYATRTIEYLIDIFGSRLTSRWLATLFADKAIKHYNTDDVIIKQDSETWGNVFLVLGGACEVIQHDGERFHSVGTREAGDLMGEMAVVTGQQFRNASVIARTPVLLCEFSEQAFDRFVEHEGLKAELLAAWSRRQLITPLPQFRGLSTRVVDALCTIAEEVTFGAEECLTLEADGITSWAVVVAGSAVAGVTGETLFPGAELGSYRPFANPDQLPGVTTLSPMPAKESTATEPATCTVLRFPADAVDRLIVDTPELSYTLRKYRLSESGGRAPWVLGQ